MDHWSPAAFAATVLGVLSAVVWLLLRLIERFRQSPRQYFWFELCGGLLLVAIGLLWLLGYPVASSTWRIPFVVLIVIGSAIAFRAFLRRVSSAKQISKAERA
jgi:hypothetical protein